MSDQKRGNLYLDVRPGDELQINKGNIQIFIVQKSGSRVRLQIVAPVETPVDFVRHQRKLNGSKL